MKDIQQSELIFYLPLVSSYALVCLIALGFLRSKNYQIGKKEYKPDKPWLEVVFGLFAAAMILMIGRVYSAGYLIPAQYNPIAWILNNLIIYSPIFIILLLRNQSLDTIWLRKESLGLKLLVGLSAAFAGVALFLLLRGEWNRWEEVLMKSFSVDGLSNFAAIFLEGVAVAFLFIRLKWATNLAMALIIPSVLFAVGHLPGMIAENEPIWHMALMSLVTGFITAFVLYTCDKTKDIIWLGIVHYFMDAAINAY